ncbi:MAG TPA: BadF/BadG/BcrA/BcrD ATPase family protein [Acidobacteriaceae bacterium]|nr:BadF/BadG/BcrA/BcrD ATPase family protein [Acidobacteriaceae bacterium]
MSLYLAIDAGGTKTRCALADETRVLARAETGTVKLMRVSEAEATARLRAMITQVASAAGVSPGRVQRTCFGLAGSRSESVQQWANAALEGFVGGEVVLCGDEEIALEGAFHGGPGVLVIAGTGSNAIGRAGDGSMCGAGGWGPVLGDEGSGYWIGMEAVRSALRVHDEQGEAASTRLLGVVERMWGVGSLGELVALGNLRVPAEGVKPADFAALAPEIARLAREGDAIATDVLRRAGQQLAELVLLVLRKLGRGADDVEEVAFAGSVLGEIPLVREAFDVGLAAVRPQLRIREEPADPLDGAIWRARKR